jgi:NAD-dependent deacetylase
MLNDFMVKKKQIIVFSGAGMSAESGIQTFRDSGGLWESYAIEDVATPKAWEKNPDLVSEFYNIRRKAIIEASPNEGHELIAKLEGQYDVTVITQNIDDLHERAGSTNVLHLHGNIRYSKSSGPDQEDRYYWIEGWELTAKCLSSSGFRLRPHVVWFGEEVPMYERARSIIEQADILIVIGTSLQVYPAAGLIHYAPQKCKCFLIDPNAAELKVPPSYTIIAKSVSLGIQEALLKIEE